MAQYHTRQGQEWDNMSSIRHHRLPTTSTLSENEDPRTLKKNGEDVVGVLPNTRRQQSSSRQSSMPIHIEGFVKRTPSEVQLMQQEAIAEYRDYQMFERIVNGILQQEQLRGGWRDGAIVPPPPPPPPPQHSAADQLPSSAWEAASTARMLPPLPVQALRQHSPHHNNFHPYYPTAIGNTSNEEELQALRNELIIQNLIRTRFQPVAADNDGTVSRPAGLGATLPAYWIEGPTEQRMLTEDYSNATTTTTTITSSSTMMMEDVEETHALQGWDNYLTETHHLYHQHQHQHPHDVGLATTGHGMMANKTEQQDPQSRSNSGVFLMDDL